MRVIKVFNNNVALVRDEGGREIVVQGRGVAFQAKPGVRLDSSLVERRFVPAPDDQPEQYAQMVADIPIEIIGVTDEILASGPAHGLEMDKRATVALADHIYIALGRQAAGQSFENPLEWEVRTLYVKEYALGVQALRLIKDRTGVQLPAAEAVPLALHFVNAQVGAGRISEAVQTARLIRDIIDIIESNYGVAFDDENILESARFATHLRYLFIGHLGGKRHKALIADLARSFREQEPQAYECAQKIVHYLTAKMGWDIDEEETMYIALHVQRMTSRVGT